MSQNKDFHIPSLDGIRGLAALIVFVSHAGLAHIVPGGFGVTIFFFLSGYLITTLLRREYERTDKVNLRHFYLRRIYRILPPMYIVLVSSVMLALGGVLPHEMTLAGVAAQFAHLANYYMIFSDQVRFAPSTGVMWSLAVEEHFYLLFPLLVLVLFRRFLLRQIAALLLMTCGIVLAWRCYLVFALGMGHDYIYNASDARLDSLLYGCIMGVWLNPALDGARLRVNRGVAITAMTAGVATLLVCFLYRSPVFRETLRYSLQGIALFPLFFCAVRFHRWPVFAWLDSKPMRALGLISYTFYLVHVLCLTLVNEHTELTRPMQGLLAFALTLAFSGSMYFLVERRLGALRRRLHSEGSVGSESLPFGPAQHLAELRGPSITDTPNERSRRSEHGVPVHRP